MLQSSTKLMAMADGPPFLTDVEDRAWRGMLALWHLGLPEVERALRPWGLLHVEYGLMAVLNMQPDRTLRLGRLASLAGMSPSRLTHRLRRLVERGLIERIEAVDDGRGVLARLTPAGDELVAEASPAHFAQVRSMIFDRLDEAQVEVLAEAMQVIATGLTDDDWWLAVRD
jgi:DNA-binding MarR family transcriptional regulator